MLELTIGSSTFYVERILVGLACQALFTICLSATAISARRSKLIYWGSACSMLPLLLVALIGWDWLSLAIALAGATAGTLVAFRLIDCETYTVPVVLSGSVVVLGSFMVGLGARLGTEPVAMAYLREAAVLLLAALIWDARGINPKRLYRRVYTSTYDDGSSSFGDDGSCRFGDDGGFGSGSGWGSSNRW